MTDLTWEEMRSRIDSSLKANSARFYPKVLIIEGLNCWGTFRLSLLDELRDLGWTRDSNRWYPPKGAAFEAAIDELTGRLPIVPGMSRENLQPLMEGSYPDADVWIEQFASYPELRREGTALKLEPARMTAIQHLVFLMRRCADCLAAGADATARELEVRAEEIYLENGDATDGSGVWRFDFVRDIAHLRGKGKGNIRDER